jgi:hypothetical protein
MKVSNRARLALAVLLWFVVTTACARVKTVVIETRRPEPVYEQLYPYYVEVCAVSQIRPIGAKKGGSAGHAVVYLKGVRRQEDAPFPTIKLCEDDCVDINDPETGVGISVNKMFKNVNWVAIPGKQLFYHGNLSAKERLTQEHFEATFHEAVDLGIFRGVEVHERVLETKPADLTTEEFIASRSLGTDYGLKFGRSIFCARLPVTKDMLRDIIAFLNELNREYATGEAHYNWSGYHDNCSHAIRNALANADIWKSKSINTTKLRQFFNLSIPANEFANLAILANEYPIENISWIYEDEVKRRSLLKRGWLPTRHGALLKTIGVHEDNELYDTRFKLFLLQAPLLKYKSWRVRRMLSEGRYLDIEPNLLHFQAKYEAILQDRPAYLGSVSEEDAFGNAWDQYYEYIEQQLEDVEEKLMKLSEPKK